MRRIFRPCSSMPRLISSAQQSLPLGVSRSHPRRPSEDLSPTCCFHRAPRHPCDERFPQKGLRTDRRPRCCSSSDFGRCRRGTFPRSDRIARAVTSKAVRFQTILKKRAPELTESGPINHHAFLSALSFGTESASDSHQNRFGLAEVKTESFVACAHRTKTGHCAPPAVGPCFFFTD